MAEKKRSIWQREYKGLNLHSWIGLIAMIAILIYIVLARIFGWPTSEPSAALIAASTYFIISYLGSLIGGLGERLSRMEVRLASMDARLASMDARSTSMDLRLVRIEETLTEIRDLIKEFVKLFRDRLPTS